MIKAVIESRSQTRGKLTFRDHRRMNRILSLYSSSIGKKFLAALTGLILFGFLVGHMAGSLKVFTGTSAVTTTSDSGEEVVQNIPHVDEYGQFLKEAGAPVLPGMMGLWIARIVLLTALIVHVTVVIQLSAQSKAARPIGYVKSKKAAASASAQYMMFSGFAILGFVIFHILHFTTGHIQLGEFEHGAVYGNLSYAFAKWWVALGYTLMMVVVGFRLYHGIWSLFQTLGLDNPDRNKMLRGFAAAVAVLLAIGFAVVPLAFMFGALPEPVEYPHELLSNH